MWRLFVQCWDKLRMAFTLSKIRIFCASAVGAARVSRPLRGVSPSKALTVQPYNRNPQTMGVFASGYPNRTLEQFALAGTARMPNSVATTSSMDSRRLKCLCFMGSPFFPGIGKGDFIQPIIEETAELDTDSEKVEYLNDYLCTLLAYKKGKTAGVTRTFAQHSGELQAASGRCRWCRPPTSAGWHCRVPGRKWR